MNNTFSFGLYCVLDNISGNVSHFNMSATDGLACRKVIGTLKCLTFEDYTLYQIGFVQLSHQHVHDKDYRFELGKDVQIHLFRRPKIVEWSSWRVPESPAQVIAPLGLSLEETEAMFNESVKDIDNNSRDEFKKIKEAYNG